MMIKGKEWEKISQSSVLFEVKGMALRLCGIANEVTRQSSPRSIFHEAMTNKDTRMRQLNNLLWLIRLIQQNELQRPEHNRRSLSPTESTAIHFIELKRRTKRYAKVFA